MKKIVKFLRNKKKLFLVIVGILFLLIYFFVFRKIKGNTNENAKTYKVKRQNIKQELVLSGEVRADKHAILHFKTSGKLVWVGVKEGDRVRQGQAIASLDKRALEKEFKKYMNYYLKTRWNFEQTKEDYKDFEVWNISEEEKNRIKRIVEQAQFDLDNSVLDVEIKNLALEESVIKAPFSGIVTRVSIQNPGVFINPSEATFEILDPDSLYFEVSADQTEVVNLQEGEKGKIVLDVFPEKEFDGKIIFISFVPKEDETGSVYKVKVSLPKKLTEKIRVGMTGDFRIITEEKKNVLALPLPYVSTDERGSYVYKFENGKRVKTYIKGEEFGEYFVVKEGLQEGDKVIIFEK